MHRTHPIHIDVGFCFLMAPRASARLRALCHPTRLCALLARYDARLNPSREGSDKGGLATGITAHLTSGLGNPLTARPGISRRLATVSLHLSLCKQVNLL